MALTATATPQVKQLVKDMLHKPLCLSSSVNKENLYYSVHEMKKGKSFIFVCGQNNTLLNVLQSTANEGRFLFSIHFNNFNGYVLFI